MEPRQTPGENAPKIPENQPVTQGHEGSTESGRNLDRVREQAERHLGQRVESVATTPAVPQLPTLPAPVVTQNDDDNSATGTDDDMPLVAADEDLIEKEWVDKAKKIISNTKDDPYRREQEVKKLQIEYVRKRYGREIGNVDN